MYKRINNILSKAYLVKEGINAISCQLSLLEKAQTCTKRLLYETCFNIISMYRLLNACTYCTLFVFSLFICADIINTKIYSKTLHEDQKDVVREEDILGICPKAFMYHNHTSFNCENNVAFPMA